MFIHILLLFIKITFSRLDNIQRQRKDGILLDSITFILTFILSLFILFLRHPFVCQFIGFKQNFQSILS